MGSAAAALLEASVSAGGGVQGQLGPELLLAERLSVMQSCGRGAATGSSIPCRGAGVGLVLL